VTAIADTNTKFDLSDSIRLLNDKIGSVNSAAKSKFRVNRISLDLKHGLSPIDWLRSSAADSKVYWSDRTGEFEMAGVGETSLLSADSYNDVERIISETVSLVKESAEGVRVYGGIRFPSSGGNGLSADWASFKSCRFVVPRFELVKDNKQTKLVCNLTEADLRNPGDIINELEQYFQNDDADNSFDGKIASRIDQPAFDGWESTIGSIIKDFSKGKIEKIVLARQTTLKFKEDCDAPALLKRLSAATSRCYHFYFQPHKGNVFLGASPEQLYSRYNRKITSEALAGTKPRGQNAESDRRFSQELLKSEKELREHKYVVDNIKAALTALCESYSVKKEASLLKLAQVQHLQTEFKGKLRLGITDCAIIKALHPTSAVGGFPSQAAQNRIAECEPFDRGWYSGVVGWIGHNSAEMAVAIRSGLVKGKELKLHSGAGIVKGSTAEAEWAEIESKIGGFISAVTG